ncbi:hypothetical protein [Polaribacter aestuariivivens]|uniref:hypothetical protein n=1 Tax=Polaribacter aestuariivivens TaxID=2304626 RepID=UPI003F490DE0
MKFSLIIIIILILFSCSTKNNKSESENKFLSTKVYIRKVVENKLADTVVIISTKFTDFNKPKEENHYYLESDESSTSIFKYSKNNQLEEIIEKNKNSNQKNKTLYFYNDTLLNKTESNFTGDDYRTKISEYFEYDKNNNLKIKESQVLMVEKNQGDTLANTTETFFYDANQLWAKSEYVNKLYPDENKRFTYSYNDFDLPIEVKEYNNYEKLNSTTEYFYTYDKFNNWIERKRFIDDKLLYVRTREIIYK